VLFQGAEDLAVRIWSVRDGFTKPVGEYKGYTYFPIDMALAPDGTGLATVSKGFSGSGCETRLWDVRAGACRVERAYHEQEVSGCAWLPLEGGSTWLASVSKDCRLVVANIGQDGAKHVSFMETGAGQFTGIAACHDAKHAGGALVLASSFEGGLHCYRVHLNADGMPSIEAAALE
jgi:WD40 repeat protein